MNKQQIVLMVHNVRSAHNIGSILRSADGLAINKVYLSGYSPYPATENDRRLPHVQAKISAQIHKTALGAENSVRWHHEGNLASLLNSLKSRGFLIAALEQTAQATALNDFQSDQAIALVVGNELTGVDQTVLDIADVHLQIPNLGAKESYNVAVATAIALYHLRYKA